MAGRELTTDQQALRVRVQRAVHAAVIRLSRAARGVHGRNAIGSDEQLRACLALARLAPLALGAIESKTEWRMPELTESQERLLDELERSQSSQRRAS